jgi:uncharacterized protein (DUF302 family)
MRTKYGFGKAVPYAVDEALKRVTEALQAEGFGVLEETDVAEAMKRKLNVSMPPYHLIAAWSPSLTQRAIEVEPSVGLLMTFNIIVREDAVGHLHVDFIDPDVLVVLVAKPEIIALAKDLRERMERVMQVI